MPEKEQGLARQIAIGVISPLIVAAVVGAFSKARPDPIIHLFGGFTEAEVAEKIKSISCTKEDCQLVSQDKCTHPKNVGAGIYSGTNCTFYDPKVLIGNHLAQIERFNEAETAGLFCRRADYRLETAYEPKAGMGADNMILMEQNNRPSDRNSVMRYGFSSITCGD